MAKIHHFIIYNIGKLSNRVEDETKSVWRCKWTYLLWLLNYL